MTFILYIIALLAGAFVGAYGGMIVVLRLAEWGLDSLCHLMVGGWLGCAVGVALASYLLWGL